MTSPQTTAGPKQGEGGGPAVCSYAGCRGPGRLIDPAYPTWTFCSHHWHEHVADMYGGPWPDEKTPKVVDWAKCGTEAGYRAHGRRGEQACDPCRLEANRVHAERRGRANRAQAAQCGTMSGHKKHLRKGEQPCEPCVQARVEYNREYERNRAPRWHGRRSAA